ncbi:hypothetical protein [Brevibacillus laterosporus]|uniref:hypothetical protein n=1 Tax=Brevibacillus laterosporus TaxID=1465 RepID=UPI003CED68D9
MIHKHEGKAAWEISRQTLLILLFNINERILHDEDVGIRRWTSSDNQDSRT